jgi:hypothetical protein
VHKHRRPSHDYELAAVSTVIAWPRPDEAFVIQCLRHVTGEPSGLLREGRILVRQ